MSERHAVVVGAGPAGLMAAEVLAQAGMAVTVYERMPSAGRKFLMAGRGGLNLSNAEPPAEFTKRYAEAEPHLAAALEAFAARALRDWSAALGQETFVGSSGRVFPAAFKASPLLRAWLRRLAEQGVAFRFRHTWQGWDGNALRFDTAQGEAIVKADAAVIACGGASWPRLGSDGAWMRSFADMGIETKPLRPSNAGALVTWTEKFRSEFAGQALKGVALSFAGRTERGEAVVTQAGLEGGVVYALSPQLRNAVAAGDAARFEVSLKPDLSANEMRSRLAKSRGKQSLSGWLRKNVHLSPVAIALLNEAAIKTGRRLADYSAEDLGILINAVPLICTGVAPIERAISSAGGVAFAALDENYMLRARPGVFVAGEMIDWEAPTGGYLLQACFATGFAAGQGAARWMARD